MTRWPRRVVPPVEPPGWVRYFDRDAWAEPDDWERQMAGEHGLPDELRRWHQERRWHAAVNAWYNAHPEADNRLEERILGRRQRLAKEL